MFSLMLTLSRFNAQKNIGHNIKLSVSLIPSWDAMLGAFGDLGDSESCGEARAQGHLDPNQQTADPC